MLQQKVKTRQNMSTDHATVRGTQNGLSNSINTAG